MIRKMQKIPQIYDFSDSKSGHNRLEMLRKIYVIDLLTKKSRNKKKLFDQIISNCIIFLGSY